MQIKKSLSNFSYLLSICITLLFFFFKNRKALHNFLNRKIASTIKIKIKVININRIIYLPINNIIITRIFKIKIIIVQI